MTSIVIEVKIVGLPHTEYGWFEMRLLKYALLLVVLSGCVGEKTEHPGANLSVPSRDVVSSPSNSTNQLEKPKPEAIAPVPEEKVTVVTPQIIDENYYDLVEKYPGQTLEVSAEIAELMLIKGLPVIKLSGDDKDFSLALCVMDQAQIWSTYAPGQKVTLRGKAGKLARGHVGILWNVLSSDANPAPILTSTVLAEKFIKNDTLARINYRKQSLYVTGKVISIQEGDAGGKDVVLDSPVGSTVTANVASDLVELISSLKVDDRFAALCLYDDSLYEEGSVDLAAIPITVEFPVPGIVYREDVVAFGERIKMATDEIRGKAPDFTASLEEILQEFRDDKDAAKKKHDNRICDVTGVIKQFDSSLDRVTDSLELAVPGEDRRFTCYLLSLSPWAEFEEGQTVTVRGKFNSFLGLGLKDAIVLKSEPVASPRVKITAEELTQKVLAAGEKANEEWEGKRIDLTGTVKSLGQDSGFFQVDLVGAEGASFQFEYIQFDDAKRYRVTERKPGDVIHLVGEFGSWDSEKKMINIVQARVIE